MTVPYLVSDSVTMLGRNLTHMRRYPSLTFMLVGMPVVFLLLFVFVFGQTLGNGLPGGGEGRPAYTDFVLPGILAMTIAAVAQGTAVTVAMDKTEGILARFRTMAIARPSVLAGHVLGAMVQSALALLAVLAVAVAIGARPQASVLDWGIAALVLAAMSFAVTWLCVGIGMACDSVEAASNVPLPLILLPMLGSGFVPAESMPSAFRWFAEYQPFSALIDAVRGALFATPSATEVVVSLVWSVAIAAVCSVWAVRLYQRPSQ